MPWLKPEENMPRDSQCRRRGLLCVAQRRQAEGGKISQRHAKRRKPYAATDERTRLSQGPVEVLLAPAFFNYGAA